MDGRIKEIRLFYNGEVLKDDEAIARIMEVASPVKVTIYSVDAESLIGAIMGRSVGEKYQMNIWYSSNVGR